MMETSQAACSYRYGPFDPDFPQSEELGGTVLAGDVGGYEGFHRDGFVYRDGRRHHRWSVRPYPAPGKESIGITRMWPSRLDDIARVQQLERRCYAAVNATWKRIDDKLLAFEAAGIRVVNHREPEWPLSRGSESYAVCRDSRSVAKGQLTYSNGSTSPITDLVSAVEASLHLELGAAFHRLAMHHRAQCFRWSKARAILDLALRRRIGEPTSAQVYVLTVCGIPHVFVAKDRYGDGRRFSLEHLGDALPITHIKVETLMPLLSQIYESRIARTDRVYREQRAYIATLPLAAAVAIDAAFASGDARLELDRGVAHPELVMRVGLDRTALRAVGFTTLAYPQIRRMKFGP